MKTAKVSGITKEIGGEIKKTLKNKKNIFLYIPLANEGVVPDLLQIGFTMGRYFRGLSERLGISFSGITYAERGHTYVLSLILENYPDMENLVILIKTDDDSKAIIKGLVEEAKRLGLNVLNPKKSMP